MIKNALLASALAVASSSAPVVGEQLQALTVLQATPDPVQDAESAATGEGGATTCDSSSANSAGGVSLCAWLDSGTARFTGASELPVTRARFLQVVN